MPPQNRQRILEIVLAIRRRRLSVTDNRGALFAGARCADLCEGNHIIETLEQAKALIKFIRRDLVCRIGSFNRASCGGSTRWNMTTVK